eukprot:jgi/Tetstr1/432159/TSEL_021616.t1
MTARLLSSLNVVGGSRASRSQHMAGPGEGLALSSPWRGAPSATRSLSKPRAQSSAQQESVWKDLAELFGAHSGDPGHWNFSPEWWGSQGGGWGRDDGCRMLDVILQMVYRAESEHNGLVEVTAHTARPIGAEVEAEWRVMRFNGITRQSVSRLVALEAGQARVAEPECLAQEYLKTMAAIYAALHADQQGSDSGMRLLCLGVGGGSLPMFLAHHFPRSHVDAVELDPVVIDAATQVMGLPAQQDNLCIHVQDAKNFVIESMQQEGEAVYDTIFMDVFDGDDNTPTSLLGEEFAAALGSILNPEHGALIMNVHGMSPALPAQTFRSALAVKGTRACYNFATLL